MEQLSQKSNPKKTIATISLAGCFGCHMSALDIDLKAIDLFQLADLKKSPLTDIKHFDKSVDIGLIEGGVCNDENVETLISFRENCHTLISLGECAIMGGLPALRNNIPLKECLEEAYINTPTTPIGKDIIPHDPDIPKILDKVYPCHEVVKIDYFIPGCPPSSDAIWKVLSDLLNNKTPELSTRLIRYD